MKKIFLPFILMITVAGYSQKDTLPLIIPPADSTGFGTPDGKLVSKTIGPGGGKIISEDGKVELIFPQGALVGETEISIQPVSNLAPHGSGKAYRFEPSGIQFKKPVDIIFHYSDNEAEDYPQELTSIAMQDEKGKWTFFEYDNWDSTGRTINGKISHFSTASKSENLRLQVRKTRISVEEPTELFLSDITHIIKKSKIYGTPTLNKNNNISWFANNILNGNLKNGEINDGEYKELGVSTANTIRVYTAPPYLPLANPVEIKAVVSFNYYSPITRIKKSIKFALKKKILVYAGFQIGIIGINDNTNQPGLTFSWEDYSRCVIEFDGKNCYIKELENNLYKLKKVNKAGCTVVYVNEETCRGPIHIEGISKVRVTAPDISKKPYSEMGIQYDPSKYYLIEIMFSKINMDMPVLDIKCPSVKHKAPDPNLGFLMMDAMQALPMAIKFEAKPELQVILEDKNMVTGYNISLEISPTKIYK